MTMFGIYFLTKLFSAYREGVRKSAREHIKPLEWWRGERYVYGRDRSNSSGPVFVPPIKEIMRIPKEPAVPLGSKHKRSSARMRSKSRVIEQPPVVYNPEEGWDDNTSEQGKISKLASDTKQGLHSLRVCSNRNWLPTMSGHIKKSLATVILLHRGN